MSFTLHVLMFGHMVHAAIITSPSSVPPPATQVQGTAVKASGLSVGKDGIPTVTLYEASGASQASQAFITSVGDVPDGDQGVITGAPDASSTYILEGQLLQSIHSVMVLDCVDQESCVPLVANEIIKPPAVTDQTGIQLRRRWGPVLVRIAGAIAAVVAARILEWYFESGVPASTQIGVPINKDTDRQAKAVESSSTFAIAGPSDVHRYSVSSGLIAVPSTSTNTFQAAPEPTLAIQKDKIQLGVTQAMKDAYTDEEKFPKDCFKRCGQADIACLAQCANEWNKNILEDAAPGRKHSQLANELAKIQHDQKQAEQWYVFLQNVNYLQMGGGAVLLVATVTDQISAATSIGLGICLFFAQTLAFFVKAVDNYFFPGILKLMNRVVRGLADFSFGQLESYGFPRLMLEQFPAEPDPLRAQDYPVAIDSTHPFVITFEYSRSQNGEYPSLAYNIKLDGQDITPGPDGSRTGGWLELKKRLVHIPVRPGRLTLYWAWGDKLDLRLGWQGQYQDGFAFTIDESNSPLFPHPKASIETVAPTQRGKQLARRLTFFNQPRPRNNMFRLEFNHTIYTAKDDKREPRVDYKLSTSALDKTQARNETINQGTMVFKDHKKIGTHIYFDIKRPGLLDSSDDQQAQGWHYPIREGQSNTVVRVSPYDLNNKNKANFMIAHPDGRQYAVSNSNRKKSTTEKFYCDQDMIKDWFDCPNLVPGCQQRFFWCYVADPLLDCSKVDPKYTDCTVRNDKGCETYPMAEHCWLGKKTPPP